MDNNKLFRLINDLVDNSDLTQQERAGLGSISKIVKLGKSAGIGTQILENNEESWISVMNHHDVAFTEEGEDLSCIIPICQEILARSNNLKSVIDFDDMIYMPVQQGLKFRKYDWVFVDESQDVSHTQRLMLKALMKPTSRMIAVGDPCQAIYGFRGADSTAMAGIAEEFSAITLPLSISYRCPQTVVAEAQRWVSHIQASPSAEEGTVVRMGKYSAEDFSHQDAVICRNVAPLIKTAYSMISRNIPVNMLGRDIGKGLISLIKNLKAKDVTDLDEKLSDWADKEMNRLSGKGENESKMDSVNDKVDCIKIFISQAVKTTTVQDLIQKIESFFSDEANGNLTLCTIHKAKGKEWDRVFILDESRFFPKWAKKEWMREQEKNIVYVAVTRAKKDLVFIQSNYWKD
jgi:superfamily I DNA/RNA helicase